MRKNQRRGVITIVNSVDYLDLRIRTDGASLRELAARFKLKDGEAACVTNFSRTRFRLIANIAGIIHLCMPERDKCHGLAEYINVAGAYMHIVVKPEARDKLGELIALGEERVTRSKMRARTWEATKRRLRR